MPNVNRKGKEAHSSAVVFTKAAGWTKAKSRKWCTDHDYYTDGHDENDTEHRWRHADPEPNNFRYRHDLIEKKNDKPSITLVLGFPKGSRRSEDEGYALRIRTALKAMEANNPGCMKTAWAKFELQEETQMSMTADLIKSKNVIRDLEFRCSKAESALEAMTKERDAAIKALADQKKAADEAAAAIQIGLEAERKRVLESHEQAMTEIAGLKTKIEEGANVLKVQTAELDRHKAALKQPALADAAMTGRAESVEDGAQGADIQPETTATSLWDQYNAISDPVQKTVFWNKNLPALKEEQRKANQPQAAAVPPPAK